MYTASFQTSRGGNGQTRASSILYRWLFQSYVQQGVFCDLTPQKLNYEKTYVMRIYVDIDHTYIPTYPRTYEPTYLRT